MNKTLIFIDGGFFSKLKKKFGFLEIDFIKLSEYIANKENLNVEQIFYYNAPPFQSDKPTKIEEKKKERYDKFKQALVKRGILFREGRCQRLKIEGNFKFNQKAVDVYLAMDLTNVLNKYKKVGKIILIACDSDFVPVIKNLEKNGVKTILYTYYDKKRNTNFSRSNDLIKSVYKYKLFTKEDLTECLLENKKLLKKGGKNE